MGNKRRHLTRNDYEALARTHGLEYLGDSSTNVLSVQPWKCKKCSYVWKTSFQVISRCKGCVSCRKILTKNEEDYREVGKLKGLEWIGGDCPTNNHTTTKWKCKNGHIWETCYKVMSQCRGCVYCLKRVTKTEKDYHDIASLRNLAWVGNVLPRNNKTKTKWRCLTCNFEWHTKYNVIASNASFENSYCPKCHNHISPTVEDYNFVAEKNGMTWIGEKKPLTVMEDTTWKCNKCGLEWQKRYNTMQQGLGGCKVCFSIENQMTAVPKYLVFDASTQITHKCHGKWEEAVAKMLIGFGFKIKSQIPIRMPDGRTYIIDFYIPEIDLYIEVKGRFLSIKAKDKWEWFHSCHPNNSEIWFKKEIEQLGIKISKLYTLSKGEKHETGRSK